MLLNKIRKQKIKFGDKTKFTIKLLFLEKDNVFENELKLKWFEIKKQ